jgi:predicted nucleotidyltransferase
MSKIFYKALGNTHLKEIINDLQTAATELSIDFFAVGALARNYWYVSNDKRPRGTQDFDFGVYVSNSASYNQLKKLLVDNYSYTPISTNSFCLMSPYDIPLDLLPFGDIEKNEKVMIAGKGLVSINLDGFVETYESSLLTVTIENDSFKFCSIPSVVLLKLIAYDDRPEKRQKDPIDIASIFDHYPDIESEMIWSEYSFLYTDDIEHPEVGIKVLGYEISKIIAKNDKLIARVISILDKAINLESRLAQNMIQDAVSETIKSKTQSLTILKTGITEGLITQKKP